MNYGKIPRIKLPGLKFRKMNYGKIPGIINSRDIFPNSAEFWKIFTDQKYQKMNYGKIPRN